MQIYVVRNGQQTGPFSIEQINSLAANGSINGNDLAWYEGAASWMPLSTVPGVVVAAMAPPPLVGPVYNAPAGQTYNAPTGQTSGLAVTSLVLGILSFFSIGLTGIPAVICGHIARSKIKRSAGTLSGGGLALAGLICGYIGFFFIGIGILAGIALPVFNSVQERGASIKCMAEAKQIGLACMLYAGDNDGKYPTDLHQLIPTYMSDDHLFGGLKAGGQPGLGYEYSGGKEGDPPKTVLLRSRGVTARHQRIVVYLDNSAELVRDE